MYVGRIVAIGRNTNGQNAALYRVSSRSFPNRRAVELNGHLAIVPRPGHEADLQKSPYISYNCVRLVRAPGGELAVATNGSHTDPIAEKIEIGMPTRDALASVLLALDYEKDAYQTPRIAAVAPLQGDTGWLGVVRHDGLQIEELPLEAGRAFYLATYETHSIRRDQAFDFDAATAEEAAQTVVQGAGFADLEKPVTSAAAVAAGSRFELATLRV